jgi:hypothetical protein
LPDGAGGFGRDFSGPALLRMPARRRNLPLRGCHPLRPVFPDGFRFVASPLRGSYNPPAALTAGVWALPLSLATTRGITLVFSSSGYLDVSVPRVRPPTRVGAPRLHRGGLPHSDTRGSTRTCRSPRIFAAYRVLPRLREPRHPPCALVYFLAGAPANRRPPLALFGSWFLAKNPSRCLSHHVNEPFIIPWDH